MDCIKKKLNHFCKTTSPKESIVCPKINYIGVTLLSYVMTTLLLKQQAHSRNVKVVLVQGGCTEVVKWLLRVMGTPFNYPELKIKLKSILIKKGGNSYLLHGMMLQKNIAFFLFLQFPLTL